MAGMDGDQVQLQQQQQQQPARVVERLNPAVQNQLNLESVKTRAISLFKAITRILEEFDAIARTNANPKWQDVLGQFSMVNLELFNIVEDIKKVSKAFVVHPKYVNAENAAILPVMLSSKLLPEMETEDNSKRELLLLSMQNLPVPMQIEKLKARMDMIGAACESAEKVILEARKGYFGTRQGPTLLPTTDKVQAAKIQEQENVLRQAVNHGEGLRIQGDQRQITSSLPAHLVDILGDNVRSLTDSTGMYMKGTPPMASNSSNSQGTLGQASGTPHAGRAAASPSGAAGGTPLDNTTASPLQYANSPRSGANMMNTPSPQPQPQPHQLQQQPQLQPQQRQKVMSLPPNQQQILPQQQFRQSSSTGIAQNQPAQLHDLQGHSPQKFQLHGQHQMQFSQAMGAQQFQGRQIASGAIQHGLGQSHLNQGNQMNRHLNQFSNPASNALFNAAQTTANSHMISNMSSMMPSQSLLPRMQYGMTGGSRNLTSQNLSDQMFNMGAGNPGSMMAMQQQQQQQQQQVSQGTFSNMQQQQQHVSQGTFSNMQQQQQQQQQQQHVSQGTFSNMQQNMQNLQPGMVPIQNTQQNLSNFQQQRPQNQQ